MSGALARALALFEIMRDADDDCRLDGLPTMPAFARTEIDSVILAARDELAGIYPCPGDGRPRHAVTWPEVDRRKIDSDRRRFFTTPPTRTE